MRELYTGNQLGVRWNQYVLLIIQGNHNSYSYTQLDMFLCQSHNYYNDINAYYWVPCLCTQRSAFWYLCKWQPVTWPSELANMALSQVISLILGSFLKHCKWLKCNNFGCLDMSTLPSAVLWHFVEWSPRLIYYTMSCMQIYRSSFRVTGRLFGKFKFWHNHGNRKTLRPDTLSHRLAKESFKSTHSPCFSNRKQYTWNSMV